MSLTVFDAIELTRAAEEGIPVAELRARDKAEAVRAQQIANSRVRSTPGVRRRVVAVWPGVCGRCGVGVYLAGEQVVVEGLDVIGSCCLTVVIR
jgi:hypothetical protein